MSAREARIQLILEWLEKHPGVASRVEDKLRSLIGVYGNASRRIREVVTDKERLGKALNIAKQLFAEEKAKIVPSTRSHQFFSEVIRRLTEEEARAAKKPCNVEPESRALRESFDSCRLPLRLVCFQDYSCREDTA